MYEHHLFCCPYASFMNTQLPQLKTEALYLDKLIILDAVGTGSAIIGMDYHGRMPLNH
jgi:hypothetical protein